MLRSVTPHGSVYGGGAPCGAPSDDHLRSTLSPDSEGILNIYKLAENRIITECSLWTDKPLSGTGASIAHTVQAARDFLETVGMTPQGIAEILRDWYQIATPGNEVVALTRRDVSLKATKSPDATYLSNPFRDGEEETPFYSHEMTVINLESGDLIRFTPLHIRIIERHSFPVDIDLETLSFVFGMRRRETDPVASIRVGKPVSPIPMIRTEEEFGRLMNLYFYGDREALLQVRWVLTEKVTSSPSFRRWRELGGEIGNFLKNHLDPEVTRF